MYRMNKLRSNVENISDLHFGQYKDIFFSFLPFWEPGECRSPFCQTYKSTDSLIIRFHIPVCLSPILTTPEASKVVQLACGQAVYHTLYGLPRSAWLEISEIISKGCKTQNNKKTCEIVMKSCKT